MSRADGPEKGRKTEDLQSKSVLSPNRREAARREQAQRDNISAAQPPTGRLCFFCRPAPRGPILGNPRRAQHSGSSGERRSKGAPRSFRLKRKRSGADFATTTGRREAPYLKSNGWGPRPSPAKRVGWGEEEQRNERAFAVPAEARDMELATTRLSIPA